MAAVLSIRLSIRLVSSRFLEAPLIDRAEIDRAQVANAWRPRRGCAHAPRRPSARGRLSIRSRLCSFLVGWLGAARGAQTRDAPLLSPDGGGRPKTCTLAPPGMNMLARIRAGSREIRVRCRDDAGGARRDPGAALPRLPAPRLLPTRARVPIATRMTQGATYFLAVLSDGRRAAPGCSEARA